MRARPKCHFGHTFCQFRAYVNLPLGTEYVKSCCTCNTAVPVVIRPQLRRFELAHRSKAFQAPANTPLGRREDFEFTYSLSSAVIHAKRVTPLSCHVRAAPALRANPPIKALALLLGATAGAGG